MTQKGISETTVFDAAKVVEKMQHYTFPDH